MEKHVAIILSAGKGKRMQSDLPKQYLLVNERPLINYTIEAFEKSFIDEIILVVGAGDEEYVRQEILSKENFTKITKIIVGGAERYDSVYNALCAIENATYVYIHDGARPCVDEQMLIRGRDAVKQNGTAIAAVKAKDTIKLVTKDGKIDFTPDRDQVWQMQTPQIFEFDTIKNAYEKMERDPHKKNITDDAMVMEQYGETEVYVYEGSYCNIKVTTPEDLILAGMFLDK